LAERLPIIKITSVVYLNFNACNIHFISQSRYPNKHTKTMKKTLVIIALLFSVLFGALPLASAVTIYTEDWGTGTAFAGGDGTLGSVGWTGVAVSQTAAPYLGIYAATGANDPVNGLALPVNTAYFTILLPNQTTPGMFYTTDGAGNGGSGDSAFTAFDPTLYTNLTFSVEVRDDGGNPTNYFAVQVGGQWYVSTNRLVDSGLFLYPQFSYASMLYNTNAGGWNTLTINATDVTIGSAAGNLSGHITGIGIVELPTTGGFDYNQIVINQGAIPPTPATITSAGVTPQYSYVGGGASFITTAAGTAVLKYRWQTNGVNLPSGGRYLGTATNVLTITNINTDDALTTYTMIVTNFTGAATNSPRSLIVTPKPPGMLYSETLPYGGPSGNLGLGTVGWAQAVSGTSRGIFQNGPGLGIFFDFSTPACTNAYFTTVTNDIGLSGLPFNAINPASYPAITLQAQFAPGNGAGTTAGNVRVYWMVRMDGTWYSSVSPIATSLVQGTYATNQFAFSTAATNWNNLTIAGNVVTIGSQASSALTGNITGAGLVFVHPNTAGASMNFQNFQITTNAVVIPPPFIGSNYPIDRGVASGGGASFGVSATGQQPFTYSWTTNGVPVGDGGRVSGATTATLTIANLNANDNGMQIVAFVTNSVGGDASDVNFGATTLTVTNPPVGLLYSEEFPFVGPVTGNYPISSVGWTEAVSGTPNSLFRRGTAGTTSQGNGAVFAFLGSANTTVYYTTSARDTNQSGLPFPNINMASYSDLAISVDIAPTFSSSNVTAYLAVQLNGGGWYVAAPSLPVPTASDSATYSTYTTAFDPTAANWKNLTITGTGGTIGSTAASNLSGVMTGAGLVFVTVNTGGTFNFDNFQITGTGVGGINVGSLTSGSLSLSWVGNPAVNLQSTTNLSPANWLDVPNTLGLYSLPVSVSEPQKFFRLVQHP
jgi:hypothetical protein